MDVQPHQEMARELDVMVPDPKRTTQKRKLYLAPRYTFKTSLIEAFIIMLVLMFPNIAIVLVRATREIALQMLFEIKTILATNPIILETFGDLSFEAPLWSESRIVTNVRTRPNKDPTIQAAGIDVSTTGMHPDCVFLDDIVVRENCDSPAQMIEARSVLQAVYPLLPPYGTMVVSGTRWSPIDAYAWILGRNAEQMMRDELPSYDVYLRSAFITDDDGDEALFYPARLTREFLEQQRRDLEPRYFASWYYNQTYEEGLKPFANLQMFDGDYDATPYKQLRLHDVPPDQPPIPLSLALIVDPSLTVSASSDSFGIVVVGFDSEGNWWVFEGKEIRKLPSYAGDDIIELLYLYEPDTLLIESANADVEMVARLQNAIRDRKLLTAVVSYSALQDERKGERGKQQRIGALEPLIRGKRIRFRRAGCIELIRQLDLYPGVIHDDVIDALAMGRKAQTRVPPPPQVTDPGEEIEDAWHIRVGWAPGKDRERVMRSHVGRSTLR